MVLFAVGVRRGDILFLLLLWPVLFASFYAWTRFFSPSARMDGGKLLLLLLLLGLGMRLLFFGTRPDVLTDDVYRYVWDGRLQAAGLNPYLYRANDPALIGWRDLEIYPYIAFKKNYTLYPPLAEFFFHLTARLDDGGFWLLRLFYLLADITCLLLLYRLCGPSPRLLIYLFFPLLIVETYGGLHFDILGAALLTAAYLLFQRRRFRWSFLLLTAAAFTKFIAGAAGPVLAAHYLRMLWREEPRPARRWLRMAGDILPAVLLVAALYLPFASAGFDLVRQLLFYLQRSFFNGSITEVLRRLTPLHFRTVASLLLVGVLAWIALSQRLSLLNGVKLSLLAMLLCSATFYPWYLIYLIPFMALEAQPSEWFLTAAVFLSYAVRLSYNAGGPWRESEWVRWLQYGPYYLLLLLDFLRGRYTKPSPADDQGAAV